MDANPPTAADFAWGESQANARSIQDCIVLIGWLSDRVKQLEALVHPEYRLPMPALPTSYNNTFGCIPRAEKDVAEAMQKMRRA